MIFSVKTHSLYASYVCVFKDSGKGTSSNLQYFISILSNIRLLLQVICRYIPTKRAPRFLTPKGGGEMTKK